MIFQCCRLLLAVLSLLWLAGCQRPESPVDFTGAAMGTSYKVRIVGADVGSTRVAIGIEQVLESVDADMSTYREDSALSRFNAQPLHQWITVSPAIVELVRKAEKWHALSAGSFDITLGSVVNTWGFGPENMTTMPDNRVVSSAMRQVGQKALSFREDPPALYKSKAVSLDLSAIAKGYAVDLIADSLEAQGFDRYLVEVGGEVRVRGLNAQNEAWHVAVEKPDERSSGTPLRAIRLTQGALATSGDYRNFFEHEGRRYSHMIDARTGWPVQGRLASVTVWAPLAADADGWATLLAVSGYEKGFELAQAENIAALFVLRTERHFTEKMTPQFERLVANY